MYNYSAQQRIHTTSKTVERHNIGNINVTLNDAITILFIMSITGPYPDALYGQSKT